MVSLMLGQIKGWRFFMWLDRYLDMITEIWMLNVLIISHAADHREMRRRIGATRAELCAIRFDHCISSMSIAIRTRLHSGPEWIFEQILMKHM